MKIFVVILAAIAISLFAFTRLIAAPNQLDIINNFWPGDGGVERVAEGVTFSDSTGLKLDVWTLPGDEKAKKPVLIFFYGGGWTNGARDYYSFVAKAYAAKGFVVVMPDYRKVPQVRFPAFVEDGAEAIKWTRDHVSELGGDPARITLSGHSAGAHIAMMLTLDQHYLSAIDVDPKIVRATVGLSGPYDFLPLDSKRSIDAMSRWPRLEETQPIHFARADAPPIMVVTSTEDDTVKPRNAILLSEKLHSLGAFVDFRVYQGLNHENVAMALSKPFRHLAPVLDVSAAFLQTHAQMRESGDADQGRRLSDSPKP
jgi:acetyl esterase/lipase